MNIPTSNIPRSMLILLFSFLYMFPPPNDSPFWAQSTKYRALDIQAANGPSRSSKLATGGPVCPVMSSGTSVVAQSVPSPRLLPVGKLVPRRPWSHFGIDFVTDLPNSEGNTCVFVAVDRFSKACKLVPLTGLPTALETAEILFTHVFWNYGIPEDIVSDRGPQFISREGLLPAVRGHCELVLWLPSPDEWPD